MHNKKAANQDVYHIDITNMDAAAQDVSKKAELYLPKGSDISFKLSFLGMLPKYFAVNIKTPNYMNESDNYSLSKELHSFSATDSIRGDWVWRFDDEQDLSYPSQINPIFIEVLNKYMYLVMDTVEHKELITPYSGSESTFDFTITITKERIGICYEVDKHIACFSMHGSDNTETVHSEFLDDGSNVDQLALRENNCILLLKTLRPMARHYGL